MDIHELRMLAEDLFSVSGPNKISTSMSLAADEIDRLRAMVDEIAAAKAFLRERGGLLREIATLRSLLERQWKADAALYAMPFEAEKHVYEAALKEHDEVHRAIGEFLTLNA